MAMHLLLRVLFIPTKTFFRRIVGATLLFALMSLAPVQAKPPGDASDRPNIIVILCDDLGYGDLECFGASDMRTPKINQLMRRGTRFNQFYANCTVCSPTRASLLTGLYPDKAGVPGVIRQWPDNSWGYLKPGLKTLPELLQQSGYATGMVGKWHLGFESPNVPNDRGFEHFHGFLADMMDDYYTHLRGGENWMRLNQQPVQPEGHATDIFTDWAIEYVSRQSKESKPFFLYLAYNAPHFPIQPPDDCLKQVQQREPKLNEKRAKNVALIEHLDSNIGRLTDTLDSLGITDRTLIVFTSDNGGSIPHAQSNGELRGGKQDHWEGGIRVPTCVVWPSVIAQRESEAIGMTMDLLPTLCDIAKASVSVPVDGISLKDVWLGESQPPERSLLWVRREGGKKYAGRAYYAIRKGPWKLQQSSPFQPMVLTNMESDPLEQSPQEPSGRVANELHQDLLKHIQVAGQIPWQKSPQQR